MQKAKATLGRAIQDQRRVHSVWDSWRPGSLASASSTFLHGGGPSAFVGQWDDSGDRNKLLIRRYQAQVLSPVSPSTSKIVRVAQRSLAVPQNISPGTDLGVWYFILYPLNNGVEGQRKPKGPNWSPVTYHSN